MGINNLKRFTTSGTFILSIFTFVGCDKGSLDLHAHHNILNNVITLDRDGDQDSPVKLVGERFFRETRFSEYFYVEAQSNFNQLPVKGDSVVETLETIKNQIENPYKGQSISCAGCHFVDQAQTTVGGGQRAYTDFARRSPVPDLQDGQVHTVRNSPIMVASSKHDDFFLHHDGEFASPEDLVRASMTGRNMGWKADQGALAKQHIVDVIRRDDGSFPTETDLHGLSYARLLAGDLSLPKRFRIPVEYQINIDHSTDEQVFEAMVHLVGGYLRSLDFKKDGTGQYATSPFDVFLIKNGFSRSPQVGETAEAYTKRLLNEIEDRKSIKFVDETDSKFSLHQQTFEFTEKELRGFKIFAGKAQCISCHAAPDFTDHLFHNTGASQLEYDSIHGKGSFGKLSIPRLEERLKNRDLFLPASSDHPLALGIFRSSPTRADSRRADLGVWNVFANPSIPKPQARLRNAICKSVSMDCSIASDDEILARTVAMIKTPTLRDLGHTQPYLHTGQMETIEDALRFYVKIAMMARAGLVRNVDDKLIKTDFVIDDVDSVAAFLKSLNEDYN